MLKFFSYRLPFKNPFGSSQKTFAHRRGIFIKLEKDGITAWGEAAPLPGFSREAFGDVTAQIKTFKKSIHAVVETSFQLGDVNNLLEEKTLFPSLQFALFTLFSSFLAQKKELSLQHFLFENPNQKIPVNAVIDLNEADVRSAAAKAVDTNFKTIKLKAGNDIRQLAGKLNIIRENHPGITLRVDANKSWSPKRAEEAINIMAQYTVEYCEEPLAAPDKNSLAVLKQKTSVPIALDESLGESISLAEAAEIADVLIIKPMVMGMDPILQDLKKIKNNDRPDIVFTSSLESGVGRLMTATLTAGLGSVNKAHGLATGHLFADDFWDSDEFIKDGFYHLPDAGTLRKLMNRKPEKLQLKEIDY